MKFLTKKNRKPYILLIALFFVCGLTVHTVYAQETDTVKQLSDATLEQLSTLDLSRLDELIVQLSSDEKGFFGSGSFKDKVISIVSGEFAVGFDNVFSALLGLVFSEVLSFLPFLFAIVAISVAGSLLVSVRSKTASSGTQSIIQFVTFGATVVVVFGLLSVLILSTRNTVQSLERQISITFPVLLTLMTALGNVNSVAVYQPLVAVLSSMVAQLMTFVILPIYIFSIVFSVIGNLSTNIKLKKLSDFFSSLSKWIIATVFFVFMTFLAIQGISASTYDGISVRTAKYAISQYVPIVGGYLSDGIHIMLAGSVLIKNAVGVAGLLLLASTVLVPVVKIAVFSLGLKLCGAVIEPIGNTKTSGFLTSVSKHTSMLIAVILSVAFMYLLTVVLVICTGNSVVG